ncbi:hypothetical protein ABB37_03141 [Leptomonas pyrrhocoris]|uniref:Uncharacterized protein n=1 Tax=Leptomonas pyrrhocoris TaxID=157538 RepID=A0A0N0DWM7_LEPPY|nr:hypothetical protein ABB37_03141 [Leptomonas pyrrhocoris]XP_015660391.1 hypothetical protein ABB37_03141 [Leptomonas pyrrhocoris]KPA81951.1 hypothetical protein ABB37_03141 [Leptomonas pyrrhocoris]KPA81952.1 hypothetical protein ABB37_03141 [Leptomonas pyrrhocoris]|eukprot:XP_015660390.1 hypothetical protein ABB37_03141 [Leptomonas pyrrhocoris]
MNDFHKILEEDKAYLEKVGMRSILQEFVTDTMEDHPANVYEYMAAWATKKAVHRHATKEETVGEAGGMYPTNESPNGVAHSNFSESRPDPHLRRHEGAFDIGHPVKEVPAGADSTPEPKVSSKVIDEVSSAIEDAREL